MEQSISAEEHSKKILHSLEAIVFEFNQKFYDWQKDTGCVANFQWNYVEGKILEIKAVESVDLISIDKIIFRRNKEISEEEIKKALDVKS